MVIHNKSAHEHFGRLTFSLNKCFLAFVAGTLVTDGLTDCSMLGQFIVTDRRTLPEPPPGLACRT